MNLNRFTSIKSNLFAENRLLKFSVAIIAAAFVFNSLMVYRAVKYQRNVLIPPKMSGTVEFVSGKPNEAYVKDLVRNVVNLATTYNPALARKQFEAVLADYAPSSYPGAYKAWYALAGEIEAATTSSVFYIQSIDLKNDNTAVIFGSLKQFTGSTMFLDETRTYLLTYCFLDGRFQILSFQRKLTEAEKKKQ